ncbi:hypothetical protein [Marinobacter nauticus]|nr:hypothetical protein [Marinobacter nauticus]
MAIQECMASLRLPRNKAPTQRAEAQVRDHTGGYMPGSIMVTFHCNQHSGQGPHIEMGNEIRGYGIHYNEFKPRFQNFKFTESGKLLTVTGDGYKFSLKFDLDA